MKLLDLYRQMKAHSKSPGYKRTQWAFLKTFRIKHPETGALYLWRLRIFQCPAFGLYLHKFYGPDPQPDIHDHPYPFASLVLKGGYVERFTPDGNDYSKRISRMHRAGHWNVMPLTAAHKITSADVPTWTLVFVGPRVQDWGFYTKDGFVVWDEYAYKGAETGDEIRLAEKGA